MMHGIVFAMLLAGFACLSLSMDRHQADVLARPLSLLQTRLLRGLGFLFIAAALPLAIQALGGGLGTVAWFGHMTLAAGVVFLALLWRRQRLQKR